MTEGEKEMKTIQINKTDFYTQFAIFNESGRIIAIAKVENTNKDCYEVEMIDKSPVELLAVYDFIRVNWR